MTPIPQDRCDGCGRNRTGYYLRRDPHMAQAFREGVPILEIAQAYGMGQEWAMKLIQSQLGLEAIREVQEQHRMGFLDDCDMCGEQVTPLDESEFVNNRPVHSACLFDEGVDVFTEAEIEDRRLR